MCVLFFCCYFVVFNKAVQLLPQTSLGLSIWFRVTLNHVIFGLPEGLFLDFDYFSLQSFNWHLVARGAQFLISYSTWIRVFIVPKLVRISSNTICSSQCRPLFIVVPKAVSELPSQHWTKRAKIFRWYCARLKNRLPEIFETAGFPAKVYLCALGQHCVTNFLVQCCLRRIWTTLTRQYSYAMLFQHGQHCSSMVANLYQWNW